MPILLVSDVCISSLLLQSTLFANSVQLVDCIVHTGFIGTVVPCGTCRRLDLGCVFLFATHLILL